MNFLGTRLDNAFGIYRKFIEEFQQNISTTISMHIHIGKLRWISFQMYSLVLRSYNSMQYIGLQKNVVDIREPM